MGVRPTPGRGDACSAGGRLEGLADHLLGYELTSDPGVIRYGPQPREGILSVLLQEFPAYTLGELLAEDWPSLVAILDYRRAKSALDLFNGGKDGAARLQEHPDLLELLLEMARAQSPEVTLDDLLSDLEGKRRKDDDEPG